MHYLPLMNIYSKIFKNPDLFCFIVWKKSTSMILALPIFLCQNPRKLEIIKQGCLFREMNCEVGNFLFHIEESREPFSSQFFKRSGTNLKDFSKCYSCLTAVAKLSYKQTIISIKIIWGMCLFIKVRGILLYLASQNGIFKANCYVLLWELCL